MTEIDIHQQQDTGVAPVQNSGDALMQWAMAADRAYSIAQRLATTSFVPQSLRGKPYDITAAILAGHELGMQPMAALRSIDIIQGTPAMRAHAMRALIQSRGHQVQVVESTEAKCVIRGRRRGDGDDDWQTVTWPIERAQRLGLTGKGEWKKQPQTMLVARATGEICRLIASDVLHAMPYASEELDGFGNADGGAQVPRVTVQELAPDVEEDAGGVADDDPWHASNAVGVEASDEEPDSDDEEQALFYEHVEAAR